MVSALKFIGGGLLRGVGEALTESGLEKRKRQRLKLEQQNRLAVENRRHKNRGIEIGQRGAIAVTAADLANERANERAGIRDVNALDRLNIGVEARSEAATRANKQANARADRADTRTENASTRADTRADRGITARIAAAKLRIEKEGGQVTKVIQNDKGQYFAVSKTGKTTDLKIRGPLKNTRRDKTGAARKRDWEIAVENATRTDENGNKTVDLKLLKQGLTDLGRPEMAKIVDLRLGSDTAKANLKAAIEEATAEAEEQGGTAGPFDSSDFPKDGSREKFIARRVREKLREKDRGGGSPGGIIDIIGTQAERQKKLNSVPIGGQVRIQGKLYVKVQNGQFLKIAGDPLVEGER